MPSLQHLSIKLISAARNCVELSFSGDAFYALLISNIKTLSCSDYLSSHSQRNHHGCVKTLYFHRGGAMAMSTDMVNTILAMSIHPYVFIHTAIVMRPKRLRTADPENHAVHCGTGPGSIAEAYTAHLTDKLSEVFLWQFLISSIAQGVCAHIGPIPGAPTHPPTHPVVVMTRGHWHCVCYVTNLPLLQV